MDAGIGGKVPCEIATSGKVSAQTPASGGSPGRWRGADRFTREVVRVTSPRPLRVLLPVGKISRAASRYIAREVDEADHLELVALEVP